MNSIWSFIFRHKKFNNCSLFDALHMAEDKLSIFNHIQCKQLSLPSRNPQQTKAQGTKTRWNKFCFKLTLYVQDIFMEALLSEHPHMFKVLV